MPVEKQDVLKEMQNQHKEMHQKKSKRCVCVALLWSFCLLFSGRLAIIGGVRALLHVCAQGPSVSEDIHVTKMKQNKTMYLINKTSGHSVTLWCSYFVCAAVSAR